MILTLVQKRWINKQSRDFEVTETKLVRLTPLLPLITTFKASLNNKTYWCQHWNYVFSCIYSWYFLSIIWNNSHNSNATMLSAIKRSNIKSGILNFSLLRFSFCDDNSEFVCCPTEWVTFKPRLPVFVLSSQQVNNAIFKIVLFLLFLILYKSKNNSYLRNHHIWRI